MAKVTKKSSAAPSPRRTRRIGREDSPGLLTKGKGRVYPGVTLDESITETSEEGVSTEPATTTAATTEATASSSGSYRPPPPAGTLVRSPSRLSSTLDVPSRRSATPPRHFSSSHTRSGFTFPPRPRPSPEPRHSFDIESAVEAVLAHLEPKVRELAKEVFQALREQNWKDNDTLLRGTSRDLLQDFVHILTDVGTRIARDQERSAVRVTQSLEEFATRIIRGQEEFAARIIRGQEEFSNRSLRALNDMPQQVALHHNVKALVTDGLAGVARQPTVDAIASEVAGLAYTRINGLEIQNIIERSMAKMEKQMAENLQGHVLHFQERLDRLEQTLAAPLHDRADRLERHHVPSRQPSEGSKTSMIQAEIVRLRLGLESLLERQENLIKRIELVQGDADAGGEKRAELTKEREGLEEDKLAWWKSYNHAKQSLQEMGPGPWTEQFRVLKEKAQPLSTMF